MTFGLFRKFGALAGALTAVAFAAGCYVDSAHQERVKTDTAPVVDDRPEPDAAACTLSTGKGCFDGYILPATALSVGDQQFFDADELDSRFVKLLPAVVQDYEFKLLTKVDNQRFLNGFEYVLNGPLVRKGKLRSNGSLGLNDLPEGVYELSVRRPIAFSLSRLVERTAENGSGSGSASSGSGSDKVAPVAAETVTHVRCGTIYADTTITVRRGVRTSETFDAFRLYVTDSECDADGDTTITLTD